MWCGRQHPALPTQVAPPPLGDRSKGPTHASRAPSGQASPPRTGSLKQRRGRNPDALPSQELRAARVWPRGWAERRSVRGHTEAHVGHTACGPTGPRLPWPPGLGPTTHLSPFSSGGKLCLTAATNSATVSSRVKITALAPASNVYATWNHEVVQTGSDQLPVPAGRPLRTRVGGRATKTRARGSCSPQRSGLREAPARPAPAPGRPGPAPALVRPWCALKQCTRRMTRRDVSLR